MAYLRANKQLGVPGVPVRAVRDYKSLDRIVLADGSSTPIEMTPSDVLLYELDGIDWFCIRPSGTEPKIKIYFGIYGDDQAQNETTLNQLREQVECYLREHL